MATKRQVLRELSFRKCKGSGPDDVEALLFFLENYVMIQHPEQGAIKFKLRPAQVEILDTWLKERNSIVLKARQIGWSTLVACYALWLAFFYPDRVIVMLSKGDREAQKLLQKSTYAYERLPAWMKERGPKRTSRNVKKLSFANESTIDSLPSKEDPARGMSVSLVIVDEWAFLENPEDAWASIEPISDVGGRVIGLSTANGYGDFFHEFWNKACGGITDFKPMFYAWHANEDRDENWYEARKRNMLEWQLHQEYPSTPEEAFIKSGNPVFDVDALELMEIVEPMRGRLDILQHGLRHPSFLQELEGPLLVWDVPETGDAYVIGADVAEGLEHGDYSAAFVLSTKKNKVVAMWHGHIPADLFAHVLAEMGWYYNAAFIGVEVNNHGLTTNKELQRIHYPKVYYRRALDQRTKKQLATVGWYTSASSKPLMIDDLGKALRHTGADDEPFTPDLWVPDRYTIHELRTFVRDEKGGMKGSPYDDRTMALAVANQMRAHVMLPETVEEDNDYWTFDWWARLANENDASKRRLRMGDHNVRHVA